MNLRRIWRSGDVRWSGISWRSRLGLGLLVALLLPTVTLAYLSVQSIRNQSVARRLLLEETYRSIAELVSSKMDSWVVWVDRQLVEKLSPAGDDPQDLLRRIRAAEPSYRWLGPLVVIDADGNVLYPLGRTGSAAADAFTVPAPDAVPVAAPGHADDDFARLFAEGELAELRDRRPMQAAALYARAADTAATPAQEARALVARARCELKGERPELALRTYRRLAEKASVTDPSLTRWAVVARYQIVECHERLDDGQAAASTVELYRFLLENRYFLDPDLFTFYRDEVADLLDAGALDEDCRKSLAELRALEEQQESAATGLAVLLASLHQVKLPRPTPEPPAPEEATVTTVAEGDAAGSAAEDDDEELSDRRVEFLPATEADAGIVALAPLNRPADAKPAATVAGAATPEPRYYVAHTWTPEKLGGLLMELLAEDGPWSDAGVAFLDAGGRVLFSSTGSPPPETSIEGISLSTLARWRVVAYPPSGTLESVATREVWRYGAFLTLVFVTVVGGLVLATRSLSREVALAKLRSDFVSSVSHELKTPLALIRMFAENLKSGFVSEERVPDYYDVMLRESERLTSLLNNVLDFSRMESGTRRYQFQETDLRDLVEEIVERYRYHFQSNRIELERSLPDEPVRAAVDGDAVRQILVNLLSNATKYIGDGDRRVRVSLARNGDRASIEVADTGIGMDAEQVEGIFQPFYRADDEQVRSTTGSGIGLTIVKNIVDAHGGSIRVDSRPTEGSTFMIELPLDHDEGEDEDG